MCRIVGIVGFKGLSTAEADYRVCSMRDSMSHGGPDDYGKFIDSEMEVALGHRRLSILDLTALGRQPMVNEQNDVIISYNGEVYNFKDLRAELSALGHRFKSDTDTEVILKAYIEWGKDSFSKLKGMFAISIYDKNKSIIYIVRDSTGIKPIYYSIKNGQLIFASEIKAFKKFDSNWPEYERWKVLFLSFGFVPEPYTTLKDVFMLPKKNYLKFNVKSKSTEIAEYEIDTPVEKIIDAEKAETLVNEYLEASVKRHMVSDAPIGVFLSGGLDSSIITALASSVTEQNINTLSINFDDNQYSENYYQELLLSTIKTTHHNITINEDDFVGHMPEIFSSMDQPTTDGVNTYFISNYAHNSGLKAVLSGLGADELFGGYPSFNRINNIKRLQRLRGVMAGTFKLFEYSGSYKLKRLSYLAIDNPLSNYLLLRGRFVNSSVASILDTSKKYVEESLEPLFLNKERNIDPDFISQIETDIYMQNQLLRDTDFMGMANSVEIRVPFLDKDFLQITNGFDQNIRYESKKLLKNCFNNFVPDEIINRRKMGFTFPFTRWFMNKLDFFTEFGNLGKNKYEERLIADFKKGKLNWSGLWSLIVLNKYSPA